LRNIWVIHCECQPAYDRHSHNVQTKISPRFSQTSCASQNIIFVVLFYWEMLARKRKTENKNKRSPFHYFFIYFSNSSQFWVDRGRVEMCFLWISAWFFLSEEEEGNKIIFHSSEDFQSIFLSLYFSSSKKIFIFKHRCFPSHVLSPHHTLSMAYTHIYKNLGEERSLNLLLFFYFCEKMKILVFHDHYVNCCCVVFCVPTARQRSLSAFVEEVKISKS
jgi:hypothetical protein